MFEDKYPTMTTDEADEALFGATDMQGAIMAKPIALDKIWCDPKQPRRVFPIEVRGEWLGSPAAIPDLLRRWCTYIEDSIHQEIDVRRLVMGADTTEYAAEADDFVELCQLAANFVNGDMTNAITVSAGYGGNFIVETGERRLLAHHLLVMYGSDKYAKIAARVVKRNLYRQASENAARSPLNAVGTARQLALLIIDMYGADKFESWEVCVPPGNCDRAYYAQVANGNRWPIKPGYLNAFLRATGIKNRTMVARYRDILNLDDKYWERADRENWSEKRCRDMLADLREFEEKRKQLNHEKATGTHTTLLQLQHDFVAGDRVMLPGGKTFGTVRKCSGDKKLLINQNGQPYNVMYDYYGIKHAVDIDDPPTPLAENDHKIDENNDLTLPIGNVGDVFAPNDRVMTPDGPGMVIVRFFEDDDPDAEIIGVYVRLDRDDTKEKSKRYAISEVEIIDETEDRIYVIPGDDGNQESGANYVDQYVPETFEDAQPLVNSVVPDLARLLSSLRDYNQDAEIEWAFDDLLETMGYIYHKISNGDNELSAYKKDIRDAKKTVRLFLEQVSRDVDKWADNMCDYAQSKHDILWSDDDV